VNRSSKPFTDGESIFLQVDLMLGGDDEEFADIAEWVSFCLIFALAVFSIADAGPRGLSDRDFVDDGEFTVGDLFECLFLSVESYDSHLITCAGAA
jgi:hypothetical protein